MILLTTSNNLKREASNNMLSRRAHRIILLLVLLLGCAGMNYVQAQSQYVYSGKCGANLTFNYNLGVNPSALTISGTGAMYNYSSGDQYPWYNHVGTYQWVHNNYAALTIGSGVTTIGDYAFYESWKLKSVSFPSTLKSIGKYAFYRGSVGSNNHTQQTITIPNSVTSLGVGAFYSYRNLNTLTIGTGVTAIPDSCFMHCDSLKTVSLPNKLKTIGNYAFHCDWDIPSIVIPNTVTTIGENAFSYCYDLKTVTLSSGLKTIGKEAFQRCTVLTSVSIPNSVTSLGSAAFYNCESMKTLTLGTGLKTISRNCFGYCTSLTSVTIPNNVTSLEEQAFFSCSGLKTINFGTGIKTIPNKCCYLCTSLSSVTIPSGVTTIGTYAFYDCISLKTITIPSTVTTIDQCAFFECTGLTSLTIPNGVKTIGNFAFCSCSALKTVTIPASVTSIASSAFNGCSSLTDVYLSWTSNIPQRPANSFNSANIKIHIPCGTEDLYRAKGWFDYAQPVSPSYYKLTVKSANSAQGKVKIGSGTAATTATLSVGCSENATMEAVPSTGYHFTKWNDNNTSNPRTVTMTAAATYTANFAINTYTITVKTNNSGLGTVSGGGTYQEGKTATLTATPANCTTAFVQWNDGNTDNPRSFTVTENKTLTAQFVSLTGNCGANGNNLTWSLNRCTGVLTISGSGAMKDWSAATDVPWCNYGVNITSVVLPYGLTHIGAYAFYGTAITKVDIPITVQSFGSFAFVYSGLQEICIPEGVTTLPNNLFHHGVSITCTTPLKRIYLPSTLTTIANQAIGRHYLSTLTYPASITSLGSSIYYSGTSPVQKDVYASWPIGQIPQKPGVNFSNPPSKPNMHVPYGTKSAYGSKGWSQFYTIVEDVDERAIDLGLSIRWASCNIGATEPEENGNFYAWGDTLTRSSFTWGTYPYSGTTTNTMTKYCTRAVNGTVDNRSTLIAFDDAAYINWGETWRMPTWTEWNELITQCTWKDTTINNISVWQVTGPNGNSIYLPKVGYKNSTSVTAGCYYWSSTLNTTNSNDQCNRALYINAANRSSAMYGLRYVGMPVRAVYRREWPSFTLTITDTPEGTPYTKAINAAGTYTLTAQEDNCHRFVRWSDGNTDNPRTVSVTADAVYTAEYETRHGICGATGNEANVNWTLSCDSILTISGTGAMADYTNTNNLPWVTHRDAIKTIIVEDGITAIGDRAFGYSTNATSVSLPSSVTSIGDYAFISCSSLQEITIPNTIDALGTHMLYACGSLTDIYVSWTSSLPEWPTDFTNKSPQSSITLHVPCGTTSLYQAATGWKSYTIVEDMPNIKSGTYGPDNIEWTFDYCDSLLTITGNGELQCDQNTWGPNAGGINPNAVKSVFIGKGVTYLGIYTLSYMTNIEYIEIEEGHPTHRTGCNAIIRIGSEHEGDTLIFGCPHTVIPTTCTTIRGYAFWDNHHVTEMTIPSSVKQIANMQGSLWQGNNGQVFYTSNSASEGLKDLYVEWTKLEDIPAVPNNRLGDMTKVRLHVPCGTTSLYKQVTGWSNFKEYIEESATFTITVQAADPTMGDVSITVN